ncbi:MAG: hypothetical protein AAB400_01900 [Patescibacteria group bacterium]
MQIGIHALPTLLHEIREIIANFKKGLSSDQANRLYGILGVLEDDTHGMSYDDSLLITKTFDEHINTSHLPEPLKYRIDAMLNKRAASIARIKFGELFG